jgi:hypothetical protein
VGVAGLFALPPKPTTLFLALLLALIRNALRFQNVSVCERLTVCFIPLLVH